MSLRSKPLIKGLSRYLHAASLSGDLLVVNASYLLALDSQGLLRSAFWWQNIHLVFWLYLNLSWYLCTYVLRTYEIARTARISTSLRQLLSALLIHICAISLFVVLTEYYDLTRSLLLNLYGLATLGLAGCRLALVLGLRLARSSGYNYRNVVILGYNRRAAELRHLFEQFPEYGYRFIGFFDNLENDLQAKPFLGNLEAVGPYLEKHQIDEVYYANPQDSDSPYLRKLVNLADQLGMKVKLVPDLGGFGMGDAQIDLYHHLPIVTFRKEPLEHAHNQLLKRAFDLVFSGLVLVFLLSWLVPLLALIIKVDSRGPVFFRQRRTGKDNRDFWCYKFRTMYVNQEADTQQAVKGDKRITRIGQFLRKTNLDELPQFFNVLLGDMSVVGPRPHMLSHTEAFGQSIDNYMVRHLIKPGITGLAQAKGYRGETQTIWDIKSRVRVDIFYIEHWSFYLDLKVLVLTVLQMVRGDENAY